MQSKPFVLAASLAAVAILLAVIAAVAIRGDAGQQQTPLAAPPLTVGQPETDQQSGVTSESKSVGSDDLQLEEAPEPPAESSILPANWPSLSTAEKVALNPHECSDVILIRNDDGRCLPNNEEADLPEESIPMPSVTGIWWDRPDGDSRLLVEIARHADQQAIESIGYGLPDDRVESCDGDTEYVFDATRAIDQDEYIFLPDIVHPGTESYYPAQYLLDVGSDSEAAYADICFQVRYRDSTAGPLESFISVWGESSEYYEEKLNPIITEVEWDEQGRPTISLLVYDVNTIESIGYGLPDDRVEGCDGDTEYDFDSSRLLESVAETSDSRLPGIRDYQIERYLIEVDADSGASEASICFYINYQDSNGETRGWTHVRSDARQDEEEHHGDPEFPHLDEISWDIESEVIVNFIVYSGQEISSVGYGLPDDRVESCDGDTEYDFDSSSLLGADGEGVAESGNSYQIIQYAVSISSDSGVSKETGICFYINYQNSSGEAESAISVYSF